MKELFKRQLGIAFRGLNPENIRENVVVGYEPVWDDEDRQNKYEIVYNNVSLIKETIGSIKPDVVYCGELTGEEIYPMLRMDNIDGILIRPVFLMPPYIYQTL